jgi:pre-mRNA-splicing factor CWC22
LKNEERYESIKREILGDSDDEDESGSEESDSESEDEDGDVAPEKAGITDMTETNLINLRRTIYLTIMNSVSMMTEPGTPLTCSSTLKKRCTSS